MTPQGELFSAFAKQVVDVSVTDELSSSFLAYSLSVITARAIPDVRDGLKPVQRRILYAMADMGMRPDRPHRKCANVVGEAMGKYHPHGDGAIYDALVRMGQDFGRNITLVDPHGNFGSLDDPPAAYRYTECRLTEAAQELLAEIEEDTVEFRPTFDGQREEPSVLPGRLPNLLVNGTTGIAVGMATNMACHNLAEVYEAIKLVMNQRRPKPSVDELMAVLPGPDFPSGGILIDDSLAEAYATGRGSFRLRAVAEIQPVRGTKRHQIVVTELPYLVGPERVITRTSELLRDGKLSGVSGVKDLSDRKKGLRIVIDVKPGVNPKGVLTELYRQTPLEDSFGINNVVLVDGVPTTLGLWDLCEHYIAHRLDIVVKRTEYRIRKDRDALHLREGRLIALDAIDLVVSIIRSSQDTPQARQRLMDELGLTEIQAIDILEMPLRRLTALARLELEREIEELRVRIAEYEAILGSDARRRTIVLRELKELTDRFGRPRRSRIVKAADVNDVALTIEAPSSAESDRPCSFVLTESGLIGRQPLGGVRLGTFGAHDIVSQQTTGYDSSTLWGITSKGRAVAVDGRSVGEVSGRSRGSKANEIFSLERSERIRYLFATGPDQPDLNTILMLVTTNGTAKRLTLGEAAGGKAGGTVITLKPGDSVVSVFPAPDDGDSILISSDAQALRLTNNSVSTQGRTAGGVAGIKLRPGATVVGAGSVSEGTIILSVTDSQTAKVTDAGEIPTKGRGTAGVRLTKFKNERRLDWAYVGAEQGVLIVTAQPDNPTKPDSKPEPLTIAHTARDLISRPTTKRYLSAGTGRW